MRIKFSNEHTAQAAANVFERYGYRAFRSGSQLVTDCPTLLAVPMVQRAVGFDRVHEVDIASSLDARECRDYRGSSDCSIQHLMEVTA